MPRPQLPHISVNGLRSRHVLERDIVRKSFDVEFFGDSASLPESLDFRAEHQPPAIPRVEQWLLADTIPRQQQPLAATIPQRDREHPAKLRKAFLAELLVKVDDRLRVTPRLEAVTARQVAPVQFFEIVNLAVERDPDGGVLVRK